ncbi:immunoglobulin superfamily DCC subclass member 3 [Alligator sinensis]|uniref:immunoglobulin superfamily DCC subclass member 3 n=1 Tax=Alligator sinensis TaxID=38654 RepID=UPI000D721E31|nr:immunoglobulin superfamily DCC subclass member 3 [Alligator sinensis]
MGTPLHRAGPRGRAGLHRRPHAGGATDASAGEYSCAAQNRDGLLLSRKARVQLATLSRFHMHPESMAVEEGGVARFQCLIQGVPEATITWERNRTALPPDNPRFTLLPAGVLQITGVRRADVGAYRCMATNIAGARCSREAWLGLSGEHLSGVEPTILSGPQNLTLTVHQTAILECIATGHPRPIVSWSRLDGRSIGVEGIQVLGTGNLMIADVSVQHSGVYVCAANRPGTRVRRTAQGILMTLMIQRIAPADEAIYQCIAENSAGTNQASARLAVAPAQELPHAPEGVRAAALSTTAIQVAWAEPAPEVTDSIIGYVLHIRRAGESESRELQEAVSKATFQHVFTNLEPSTTYSIYLRAYSPLGASQDSQPILATTLGSIPAAPGFFTKVLNASAVQAFWELPSTPGSIEGFKLFHRRLPGPWFEGPQVLGSTANSYVYSDLEPSATYEIKLQAFNGNGDGNSSLRLVSLQDSVQKPDMDPARPCPCSVEGESSLAGIVVGVHIGMACIIFCVLFLMFGYRKSLFCRKGAQSSWTVPQGAEPGQPGTRGAKPAEMIELVTQAAPHVAVTVERCPAQQVTD